MVGNHRFTEGSGSVEQRLAAVEAQQAHDHAFFSELTAAVRGLIATGESLFNEQRSVRQDTPDLANFDLQIRKELAIIRSKIETDVTHSAATTAAMLEAKLEGKFQDIQNAITALQVNATNANDREGQMAEYLNSLHGARPQEGHALLSSFQYVNSEITSVKERVKHFEQLSQKTPFLAHTTAVFTEEMRVALMNLHGQAAAHDSTFAEIHGAASLAQQRLTSIEAQITSYEIGRASCRERV